MTQALILANALAFCDSSVASQAAAELRAQHARIAELESTLEAIGAGGVEPLRKTAAAPQAVPGVGALYALQEAEAALELAIHRILKRDPGHAVHVTSEAKALVAVRAALDTAAPAHPAEGVPPQASEWDGKLPERLQSVLNALRLELPAAVVNDVEFEVRSHYEAMHTSLSTSRRMYGAARDRLEAIDAAQPDPFAATQPAAQGMDALTPAARDVLAERKRQIETEGWKPESDDVYDTGEMALAAACYAAHSASCAAIKAPHTARGVFVRTRSAQDFVGEMWPWSADWWKPSDHRRNLEKAAALILAEIERIDRVALAAQAKQGGV